MALNAYLKLDGVKDSAGSTVTIELLSFSWGLTNTGTGGATGGGGAGRAMKAFHVSKTTDSSSPKLVQACATGEHLGKAELGVLVPAVQTNAGQEYIKFEFSHVLVTEVETGGNFGGAPQPVETVKFEFNEVAILLPAVQ